METAEGPKSLTNKWEGHWQQSSFLCWRTIGILSSSFCPKICSFWSVWKQKEKEKKKKTELYIHWVFSMGNCEELISEYLKFTRGAAESKALPLSSSHEMSQQSRNLKVIRKKKWSKNAWATRWPGRRCSELQKVLWMLLKKYKARNSRSLSKLEAASRVAVLLHTCFWGWGGSSQGVWPRVNENQEHIHFIPAETNNQVAN